MADAALLAEAYKRGLLPPDKASAYEEGVRRGIVTDGFAQGRIEARAKPSIGATATFNEAVPLLDEFTAGADALINRVQGKGTIAGNWRQLRDMQAGNQAEYKATHPGMANLMTGLGYDVQAVPAFLSGGASAAPQIEELAAKTLAQRGGQALMTGAKNATVGAGAAAVNAATGRGSAQERIDAAKNAQVTGAVLGAAIPAGAAAAGKVVRGLRGVPSSAGAMTRNADAEILRGVGVQTSIPQKMGGLPKQVEDLAMRAPILGPAISGARTRQVEQLNRGVGLKALEPIGEGIPADVKPGFPMVDYVDERLGAHYQKATDMVPHVQLDEQLIADAAKIGAKKADLAESEQRQWDSILQDRLMRLQSGEASGQTVKDIHSELGGLQREQARKGNATLSGMIGDLRQALMGTVARANPEAAKLISEADAGWRNYSIMNDAAASATNRGGVFLPGQLNTQVRSAAKGMGSNMAGKGKGPMQDVATAATRMIPDQFGNPGTANAVGLGGMGVGLMTQPAKTVAVAGGLTVAATPYWAMARKIVDKLPANAGRAEIKAADAQLARIAANDPGVKQLRQELASRLAPLAGPVTQEVRR